MEPILENVQILISLMGLFSHGMEKMSFCIAGPSVYGLFLNYSVLVSYLLKNAFVLLRL